jgi:recombination protein RecA
MSKVKKEKKAELLLEEEEPKQDSKLESALKLLEKDYGKGVVIGGADRPNYEDVISTGSVGLDSALGIGGLPMGKLVEFIGWESSGKSTLTLHLIANAQKKGLKCLLADGENSFDEKYARALGVDPRKLLYLQLDGEGGEKVYDVAERLIKSGGIQVAIFDSQNSLQPKKVMEDPVGSSNMGLHARMLGRVCVQLNHLAQKNNCLCIFISQIREKIGIMFGSPETTQGGNALKFYAHIRLDIRKSVLRDGEKEAYANKTKVKVIKNKMAPPFKEAEFNINFGTGIDVVDEIINLGSAMGLIKKWGKTITLLDNGAGGETKYELEEFKGFIEGEDGFYEGLKKNIMEKLKTTQLTEAEEENE